MRARRGIMVTVTVGAMLSIPTEASANGGAYIEFDQTHYLPGDAGVGTTYVSVPTNKLGLLDQGPFYAFALPRGTSLQEGRPIPAAAIRIGTFTIAEEKKFFELTVYFTVPEIAGGFYSMGLCNDPCTLSGFGEPLTGSISVVETALEAELLKEKGRLRSEVFGLKQDLRKSERQMDDVQGLLAATQDESATLSSEVEDLRNTLAQRDALLESESVRPLIEPWAVVAVCAALLALAAALLIRIRRRGSGAMVERPSPA